MLRFEALVAKPRLQWTARRCQLATTVAPVGGQASKVSQGFRVAANAITKAVGQAGRPTPPAWTTTKSFGAADLADCRQHKNASRLVFADQHLIPAHHKMLGT